jgi:zinc D-Ala-D-Ala carboxypeptidase
VKLTEHFDLEEMIRSDYAIRNRIDNTPSELQIANLKALCENVLEPLQEIVKKPLTIQSGFRSQQVNSGIGGASSSQHLDGKAADITVKGMTVDELFEIASKYVPYDQVIHEFGRWVHISYANPLRRTKLWAVKENGKTLYLREKK